MVLTTGDVERDIGLIVCYVLALCGHGFDLGFSFYLLSTFQFFSFHVATWLVVVCHTCYPAVLLTTLLNFLIEDHN